MKALACLQYHELPERIRTVFSPSDWRNHVKEQCIQRGIDWGSSLARTVCSEGEYYGELLKCYKGWMRLLYAWSACVARNCAPGLPNITKDRNIALFVRDSSAIV
eukprot:1160766-Pelagomonas_calceolata.AAC.7